jgi:hypothetical protein
MGVECPFEQYFNPTMKFRFIDEVDDIRAPTGN